MDIDRQFKDQLKGKDKDDKALKTDKVLTMQKHRERPVICKNCKIYYLEAQNHSLMCKYHPGKFAMQCPLTCPNPGNTQICISHKRNRWSCCDGSLQIMEGCSRKSHMPQDLDPVYEKIMSTINIRDSDMLTNLDAKVEMARNENWAFQEVEINSNQLYGIIDPIEEDRKTANKYRSLKFF
jgi:hypothetical protein